MKTITSRQNPVVRAFRDLADHPDPTGARLLLDGAHLVRDAIDAGLEFEMVCVAASRQQRSERGGHAGRNARESRRGGRSRFQTSSSPPSVRCAHRRASSRSRRRHPTTVDDICSRPSPLMVVSVDVQDPGNVGALSSGSPRRPGRRGSCVTGASANPFSWKALRGSMGSALRLPVVTAADLPLGAVDPCAGLRSAPWRRWRAGDAIPRPFAGTAESRSSLAARVPG